MKKQRDMEAVRLCMGTGVVLVVVGLVYLAVIKLSSPNQLVFEAIARRDSGLLKRLISQGASVNVVLNGTTPLISATQEGNNECMQILLDHGANVNAKDPSGTPVLGYALEFGSSTAAAKLLLDHGADPNIALNAAGDTPLIVEEQTMVTDPEVIKALLKHGANPNRPNKRGLTPLRATSDKKIKQMLVAAGAR